MKQLVPEDTMPSWINVQFESPKILVNRACNHIEEAAREIEEFFSVNRYITVTDLDLKTGQDVYKVRFIDNMPSNISAIVKDAAGNLRDALDHAVYASAVCLTGGKPEKTGFPFARDLAGVTGELSGPRLKGNPPEIRPFLATLNPYRRSDSFLWGLNQIRNPNTHRVLVPVGNVAISNVNISNGVFSGAGLVLGYSKWNISRNEVEFMRLPHGSKFDSKIDVAIHVAFGDVDTLKDRILLPTLASIACEVDKFVRDIETETTSIIEARQSKS